jgi:replicative DNA helicase
MGESPDIFQDYRNKKIVETLKYFTDNNIGVDYAILCEHLKEIGEYNKIGVDYLGDLAVTGSSVDPEFVLKKIKESHYKKQLLDLSKDIYSLLQNGKIGYADFIDELYEIKNQIQSGSESLCSDFKEFHGKDINDIYKKDNYISYHLLPLDQNLIGIFKNQLIVIAGSPGSGKTTFAFQICCNYRALFFTLEMSREELYAKLLAAKSGISSLKIESNSLTEDEYRQVMNVHKKLKETINIKVFDKIDNCYRILNIIEQEVKKGKIDLIGIDYLQLLEGAQGGTRNEQLESITRAIKNKARRLQVPIILLSQLTKDVIKEERRPNLGDLRGSGSIAQDADVVIFIYEKKNQTNVVASKVRKGKTGVIDSIYFNKEFSRFENREFYNSVPMFDDCKTTDYFHD